MDGYAYEIKIRIIIKNNNYKNNFDNDNNNTKKCKN